MPEGFQVANEDINLEDVYMYHIGRREGVMER